MMKLPGENIVHRWPTATPVIGLAVSLLVAIGLLLEPWPNGPWLSLLAAGGALLNAAALLPRLAAPEATSK
jgi:hypothetical protein